jgi:hypothetical protein
VRAAELRNIDIKEGELVLISNSSTETTLEENANSICLIEFGKKNFYDKQTGHLLLDYGCLKIGISGDKNIDIGFKTLLKLMPPLQLKNVKIPRTEEILKQDAQIEPFYYHADNFFVGEKNISYALQKREELRDFSDYVYFLRLKEL